MRLLELNDQSDTKQNEKSSLETGLQQEKKDLIHQSKKEKKSLQSRQLRSFPILGALLRRKEGIKRSINLARRNVVRSKYRTTLLILGIILTVGLETGIVISVDTLYDDFELDNRNQNYTDITVHPTAWHGIEDLRTLATSITQVSGVSKSSPVYYTGIDEFVGRTILGENATVIYGIDTSTHPDFPNIDMIAGKRFVDDNTIIISERIQKETGLEIDEVVNLEELGDGFESIEVIVGGVMSDEPFFGNKIGFTFILVDIDTLYETIPSDFKHVLISEIDIEVTDLVNTKATSENIKDFVGISYYVFTEKDISEIEGTAIRAYQTAMNLVILASFVVEFLFITNILAISMRDRSKEFGILRSMGTGSYQLIESVTAEILIYSAIGCSIGVVTGIGFSTILLGVMDYFYAGLEFQDLSLHYSSLIATYMSGMLVALISGLYPIFIAISKKPVQNIHSRMRSGNTRSVIRNSWKYTIIAGGLLSLVGFSLQFFVGPSRFLDFELLSVHFLTVLLIFFGTLLLEVGILVFLPRMAMRMLFGFDIITRTISTRNIAREFQKSLFTIMTSALALTFIIVVGLVSAAVISGVPTYFQSQWGAIDLVAEVSDRSPLSINYTSAIEHDQRIIKSSFIQESRTEISEVDGYVYGVDPSKYAFFSEPVVDSIGNESSFRYLDQAYTNRTNGLISHLLYQKLNIPLGSNVSIKIADNTTVNVTLTSVIKANVFLGNGEYLYISTNRFQEFYQSILAKWLICDVVGDVFIVQQALEMEHSFKDVMAITHFVEMMERSLLFQAALFQLLFVESFILAAFAQFVSILISTLHMEREIGIMRALGLSKMGIFNIFMVESIIIGVTVLGLGVLNGLICSLLLSWYIGLSIPIEIRFPLEQIMAWALFSFLITLGSTFLPSYRSSSKNINDTISGRPNGRSSLEESLYPQVFYLYWLNRTSEEFRSNFDIQEDSSKAYEEIKNTHSSSSIPLWQFIKDHTIQFRVTFVILMAIIALNYILDGSMIPQGLIPFDWLSRIYLSILPQNVLFEAYFINFFYFINPSLFLIGLALVGPIAHYFVHKTIPTHLTNLILRGLIWGFIGCILCLIIPFLLLAGFVVLLAPFSMFLITASYENSLFSLPIFLSLGFFVFELYLFQRLWVFLVFEGISSGIPIDQKLSWMRSVSTQGRFKFIGLLVLHSLIQVLLTLLFKPFLDPLKYETHIPFLTPFSQLPINPIIFLILASFEVIFYLILILYEILQLQQQASQFPPTTIFRRRKSDQKL
jgi:putative ABC transport system permease protein